MNPIPQVISEGSSLHQIMVIMNMTVPYNIILLSMINPGNEKGYREREENICIRVGTHPLEN